MMKSFLLLGLGIFSCVTICTANAQETRIFKSAEGVEIAVSYNIQKKYYPSNKPYELTYLNPVSIKLSSDELTKNSQARAVFINRVQTLAACGLPERIDEKVYALDLSSQEIGILSGDLNEKSIDYEGPSVEEQLPLVKASYYCNPQQSIGQEIAIVINGHWLKDPISGTNNFKIN